MEPNYRVGDRLVAYRWAYATSTPKRGDVVLFVDPDYGRLWSARVAGVAGDTVSRKLGRFFRNNIEITGAPLRRHYIVVRTCDLPTSAEITIHSEQGDAGSSHKIGVFQGTQSFYDFSGSPVPEGHLFLLDDNRDFGGGSHDFGTVPISSVKGKVFTSIRRLGPVSAMPPPTCIRH